MKIRMIAVAALGLAAACGGGAAAPSEGPGPENRPDGGPQGDMAGMGGISMGGGQPSVFSLLGARERMALNSEQVTALDSINRVWASRNDLLQRQLRAVWGSSRSRTSRSFEEARPVLIQIAENNEIANRAVESLLNPEQRLTACAIQVEQRGEAAGRAEARDGRPVRRPAADRRVPVRRPRGTQLDTIPGARAIRGWPWCAATLPADTARRR